MVVVTAAQGTRWSTRSFFFCYSKYFPSVIALLGLDWKARVQDRTKTKSTETRTSVQVYVNGFLTAECPGPHGGEGPANKLRSLIDELAAPEVSWEI